MDASRDKILRDANEEAFRILKEAKDVADETIRNFNKYGKANAPMSEMEKERTRLRDKMNASQKKLADQKKNAVPNHKVPKKLQIGDTVKVISMNLKGTVHTLPNAKGDLYVQMGILRSLVNINDLILIDEDSPDDVRCQSKQNRSRKNPHEQIRNDLPGDQPHRKNHR